MRLVAEAIVSSGNLWMIKAVLVLNRLALVGDGLRRVDQSSGASLCVIA
jgi:hypothetical protein